MKFLLLSVLCMLLLSCDHRTEVKNIKRTTLNRENSIMTGIWTLTASSDGKNMYQYNICPLLKFGEDGYGVYGSPNLVLNNQLIDNFKWKMHNQKLKIEYILNTSNRLFYDSIYEIYFDSVIIGQKGLIVSGHNQNETYYLSR